MKFNHKLNKLLIGAGIIGISLTGCKKFADVDPASNILASQDVFSSDATVANALSGMYVQTYLLSGTYYQTYFSACTGAVADELMYVGTNSTYLLFYTNAYRPSDAAIANLWTNCYKVIYTANMIIEGVAANQSKLSPNVVSQTTGEALFMRALSHFYLTNLFGDVPLATSSNVEANRKASRAPQSEVYSQIIDDLNKAKDLLGENYVSAAGTRIKPNKYAAAALLARVYLYAGQWASAEAEADQVINATANGTPLYQLYQTAANLPKAFYKSSTEAIWQMNGSTGTSTVYNGYTALASVYVASSVNFALTPGLINSFETGDLRKANWSKDVTYLGTPYTVPNKYRNTSQNTTATAECYTYLRLAEQYLIRAEARAQLGQNLAGAAQDINTIRNRAGLGNTTAATKDELLNAVAQERKVEFFGELGFRWFDLKRTGKISQALSTKSGWTDYKALLPIPATERLNNPNLTQNDGYN